MLGIFSKKKVIVAGVAIFGGIAMATTGFASWVFGVVQASTDVEADNVVVVTTESSNVITLASLTDSSINIREPQSSVYSSDYNGDATSVNGNDNIYFNYNAATTPTEEAAEDFAITFDSISLTHGSGTSARSIVIDFDGIFARNAETQELLDGENDTDYNVATNSSVVAFGDNNQYGKARTGDSWDYIGIKTSTGVSRSLTLNIDPINNTITYDNGTNASASLTPVNAGPDAGPYLTMGSAADGSKTYTIHRFTVNFYFSDFYNDQSPCEYYQSGVPTNATDSSYMDTSELEDAGLLTDLVSYTGLAATEGQAFRTAVNGKTVKLTVTSHGSWE